ncbi:MAG TPA: SDR family NAD(P)-dependent oxidoreductase [Acidobacteriaceae bacterium]|jgi:3-oxoacyl-[acyl-carrier protein] reductase|nr:SDR family NAD(P)-dependent oxidoreductase [Acidobacteriaceae bacterium]
MNALTYPDLKGKVVLVTGASKALGVKTARQFARSGARVVVNGRDEQALKRVSSSISSEGGECIGIAAHVTSAAELIRLQASIQNRFGDVSILAAFAGGLGNSVPILDISEDQWRKTIDADLNSKFLTVKTFVPAMKTKAQGNIILMSSASGRLVSQASAAYGAAQAGTLMLMRHLAQELGPFGIRANGIAPSIVRNEKIEKFMPAEMQAKVAEGLPLRRIGTPEDVAQAALFLASDASGWITGHTLDVNGGKLMV